MVLYSCVCDGLVCVCVCCAKRVFFFKKRSRHSGPLEATREPLRATEKPLSLHSEPQRMSFTFFKFQVRGWQDPALASSRLTGVLHVHVRWLLLAHRSWSRWCLGQLFHFRVCRPHRTKTATTSVTACYTPIAARKNHGHTPSPHGHCLVDTARSCGAVWLVLLFRFYGHLHQQELSQQMREA